MQNTAKPAFLCDPYSSDDFESADELHLWINSRWLFSLVLAGVKVTRGTLGYELVEQNIRGMLQVEEY